MKQAPNKHGLQGGAVPLSPQQPAAVPRSPRAENGQRPAAALHQHQRRPRSGRCFLDVSIQQPPLQPRRVPAHRGAAALTSSSCGPPGIPAGQEGSKPSASSSRPRSLSGSRSAVSPLYTGGGDSALLNAAILNCESEWKIIEGRSCCRGQQGATETTEPWTFSLLLLKAHFIKNTCFNSSKACAYVSGVNTNSKTSKTTR